MTSLKNGECSLNPIIPGRSSEAERRSNSVVRSPSINSSGNTLNNLRLSPDLFHACLSDISAINPPLELISVEICGSVKNRLSLSPCSLVFAARDRRQIKGQLLTHDQDKIHYVVRPRVEIQGGGPRSQRGETAAGPDGTASNRRSSRSSLDDRSA